MKKLTVVAVIEITDKVAARNDRRLLDDVVKRLGSWWICDIAFCSVNRGVTKAAVDAGAEED